MILFALMFQYLSALRLQTEDVSQTVEKH